MDVIILTNTDIIKKTGAAYSRCRLYALALARYGKGVCLGSILNLVKESSHLENDPDGFKYIGGERETGYLKRNLYRIFLPIIVICMLRALHKKGVLSSNTSVIWTPNALFTDLTALLYMNVIAKARVYCEKNELQQAIISNRIHEIGNIWNIIFLSCKYINSALTDELTRYYHGVLAISTNLYRWSHNRNRNILLIPILVGAPGIKSLTTKPTLGDNSLSIGYFGYLSNTKDGFFDFLEVLGLLMKDDLRFILDIYGTGRPKEIQRLRQYTAKAGLAKTVHYKGSLTHSAALDKMCDYDLLVLPRPRNKQTQFGFSTKLGEYLLSGSAVLATDISDNRLYIKDGLNGFIVPPDDKKAMQEKLKYIFAHRQDLKKIGTAGRTTALNDLYYSKYSQSLGDFITK